MKHAGLGAITVTLLIALARAGLGQVTTADIAGRAVTADGVVVSSVSISLENLSTHEKWKESTNRTGRYAFMFVAPGHYSVTAASSGFKTSKLPDIGIRGGDHARVNVSLISGLASEVVKLSAESPMLQADSSTILSTIGRTQTENLPLPTRNLTSLITYTAGASEGTSLQGLSSGQRPDDRRMTSLFVVNAQDDILNNEMIDGTDNNERIIGSVGVKPAIDSIAEVNVQTNVYAPEIGRTPGGAVSVITKYGTDAFHGDVYEFLGNDFFNARNPYNPIPSANTPVSPKSEERQNDFGGSLGGPVLKRGTYFFGAYEGFRQVKGVLNPILSTVPTLAEEQAGPQAIVSANPATAALGLPVDPIAATVFKLYPAPNTGGPGATSNNFIYDPANTQSSQVWDARVDHRFSARDTVYARYSANRVNSVLASNLPNQTVAGLSLSPGSGDIGYTGPAKDDADNYQLHANHTFSPTLVMELSAAFTRVNNNSSPSNVGTNAGTAVGFGSNVNYGPISTGLPLFDLGSGFAPIGDSEAVPLQELTNTFQYAGAISKSFGNHIAKAGGQIIRRQAREYQSTNPNGNFNFNIPGLANPGASLATFLTGSWGSTGRVVNLLTPDYRGWEPGFYAQDTWMATPRLTVNYGVRYDVFTPFTERRNRLSNFDIVTDQLLIAGQNGVSDTAGISTDYTSIAPRLGFAATLFPGTVLRGGFGISYFPGNYGSYAAMKNPPFASSYAPACASTNAVKIEQYYANVAHTIAPSQVSADCATLGDISTLDGGVPLPTPQTINSSGLILRAVQRNFKSGAADQFNLGLQHSFGQNVASIGYVGVLTRHAPAVLQDINVQNPRTLSPAALAVAPRPLAGLYPHLGSVGYVEDEGEGSYHSLQATFQRRIAQGLSFQSSYFYSHALDDYTNYSNASQEGFSAADPFDIRHTEYGNGDLDLRHRFVATATYELPFGKGKSGFERKLLQDIFVNEVYVWNTGNPFTIDESLTSFAQTVYKSGLGGNTNRPEQIAAAKLAHPTPSEWFNTAAFVRPSAGTIPNTPRNSLYGPHFQHFDLSAFKDVTLTERAKLEVRAEAFNLSNTPIYYVANNRSYDKTTNDPAGCSYLLVPGSVCTAPLAAPAGFGTIVRTNPSYTPRELQLALKLLF